MIHQMPQATYSALSLSPAPARDVGRGTGGEETRASGRERELMHGGGFLQQPAEGGKASDDQLFQDTGTLLLRLGVCGMAGGY